MYYQAIKKHGETVNTCCLVNEANLKKLYTVISTVWVFGKGKTYRDSEKISGCWGMGAGMSDEEQEIFRAVKLPCMIL